jgi:hypothetical protein
MTLLVTIAASWSGGHSVQDEVPEPECRTGFICEICGNLPSELAQIRWTNQPV